MAITRADSSPAPARAPVFGNYGGQTIQRARERALTDFQCAARRSSVLEMAHGCRIGTSYDDPRIRAVDVKVNAETPEEIRVFECAERVPRARRLGHPDCGLMSTLRGGRIARWRRADLYLGRL
jgi:hypothetical protein